MFIEWGAVTTANEPVSVATFKEHARTASSTEDTLIEGYIAAAREYIEKEVSGGRLLAPRSITVYLPRFPYPIGSISMPALVEHSSDVAVGYIEPSGTTESLVLDTDYMVETPTNGAATITPILDWPDTHEFYNGRLDPKAVQINAVVGSTVVPPMAKQAVLLLAADWYEHREDEVVGVVSNKIKNGLDRIAAKLNWGYYG